MHIRSAIFTKGIRGTDDILQEPKMQVAFIGRSNVGKSSLINCLINKVDLVKSGQTPGKTKEINFFLINDDTYFVDLPGYGFAKLPPETRIQIAKMIQWYFMEPVYRRKVVVVLDVKAGPSVMDIEMLRILREQNQDVLIVANKVDALNQSELHARLKSISEELPGFEIIPASAKTKVGKEEILKSFSR